MYVKQESLYIYTICVIYGAMIIHAFIWHHMLKTIAIVSYDCDTGWSNYFLAHYKRCTTTDHHHLSIKCWYTVKHGTWNGMESAMNKIILHIFI